MNLRSLINRVRGGRSRPPETPAMLAAEFAKRGMVAGAAPSPDRAKGPLASYFDEHREGRGIWKWEHYFDVYERHLSKFTGRETHVVEIGIYSGGSLEMWRRYFGPRCRITGIDIEEACRAYEGERVSVVIGDQADRRFWRDFREHAPPIDVLIDDGGHTYEQQRVTLEETLPYLRPGGVYLCEDVHGTDNQFAAYAHALAAQLNAFEAVPEREADGQLAVTAPPLQRAIRAIHFYPFLVVIEKSEQPVDRLVAPRRGSHWEPFL